MSPQTLRSFLQHLNLKLSFLDSLWIWFMIYWIWRAYFFNCIELPVCSDCWLTLVSRFGIFKIIVYLIVSGLNNHWECDAEKGKGYFEGYMQPSFDKLSLLKVLDDHRSVVTSQVCLHLLAASVQFTIPKNAPSHASQSIDLRFWEQIQIQVFVYHFKP